MFKEYISIAYLGRDYVTKHIYQYKIIDDDFEKIDVRTGQSVSITIAAVIIDFYSKRNLPIVPNLIRGMLWCKNKYNRSLDNQIIWNKRNIARWPEFEQEIKKYLLFS